MDKGRKEASLDAYEPLHVIGSGSYGKVVQVRRKVDGRLMVWKELNYGQMSDKEKQLIVSEVNILREFRHPNIVRYHDRIIVREARRIYIIMEYCEGGDLAQLIRSRRKSRNFLEEDKIWTIFLQLCLALRECHTRKEGKVLHRDIKPANILLSGGNNIHVKLGDFGLARILSENSRFAYTNVGTPFYMSPEQIDEMPYDEKCDIWSLGCVLYELCTLHPPFEAANQLSLAVKIKEVPHEPCRQYSRELSDIIDHCLSKNPKLRPSVEELLGTPAISLRLKERKINEALALLKKKEDELRARADELSFKEKQLDEREQALEERERQQPVCSLCGHAAGAVLGSHHSLSPVLSLAETPQRRLSFSKQGDHHGLTSPVAGMVSFLHEDVFTTPVTTRGGMGLNSPADPSPGPITETTSPNVDVTDGDKVADKDKNGLPPRPPTCQRQGQTVAITRLSHQKSHGHRGVCSGGITEGSAPGPEGQKSLYKAFRVAK